MKLSYREVIVLVIVLTILAVLSSRANCEWPQWGFDNFTGVVVYISPTVKGVGCVGTDFLHWREWNLGVGATPVGWGLFISRDIWILPIQGAICPHLAWGEKWPIHLGVSLAGRW